MPLIWWRYNAARSSRASALSQLKDVLQSLPEVYELLITLGGRESTSRLSKINSYIYSPPNESVRELAWILTLQRLLDCHSAGFQHQKTQCSPRNVGNNEGKLESSDLRRVMNCITSERSGGDRNQRYNSQRTHARLETFLTQVSYHLHLYIHCSNSFSPVKRILTYPRCSTSKNGCYNWPKSQLYHESLSRHAEGFKNI